MPLLFQPPPSLPCLPSPRPAAFDREARVEGHPLLPLVRKPTHVVVATPPHSVAAPQPTRSADDAYEHEPRPNSAVPNGSAPSFLQARTG